MEKELHLKKNFVRKFGISTLASTTVKLLITLVLLPISKVYQIWSLSKGLGCFRKHEHRLFLFAFN